MSLLMMAISVLSLLLIVSTSGFPTHKITEKSYLGRVRPSGSLRPPVHSISLPMTITQTAPLPEAEEDDDPPGRKVEEDKPPERTSEEDEPLERMSEEDEPPERKMEDDEPPERTTEEDEPQERISEDNPPERKVEEDEPPVRTTEEDEPLEKKMVKAKLPPKPLEAQAMPAATRAVIFSPRDKRAVVWKVPKIRIPSITHLFKPKAKATPSGGGPSSAPLPKAGPGSFGAGSAPHVNNKASPGTRPFGSGTDSSPPGGRPRQKGGSKSGGSNSFPDLGDLPSFDDWGFSDFSKSDGSLESGVKSKEEDNKTTTEKSVKKWDDHHFPPDYDYPHGWYHS